MSRGLLIFAGFIGLLALVVGLMVFLARGNDGPIEILAGGPFTSGELVENVSDWSFLSPYKTVELQTMSPPSSRVMWLVVHENRVYMLSTYMNTAFGKLWKRWPHQVEKDNRAVIRADGKLYELEMERITDGEQIAGVLERFNEKYKRDYTPETVSSGRTWLYELTAR